MYVDSLFTYCTAKTDQTVDAQADWSLFSMHVILYIILHCGLFEFGILKVSTDVGY